MTTITVNVPEQIMTEIAQRAKNSGYADVSEFVSQYILQIAARQSEVEQLAIDGLQSGPSEPWSEKEIDVIREQLKTKYGS